MAIMGRKKRSVARGWEAVNKQRDEEAKKLKTDSGESKDVSVEDHEARLKLLRSMGLLK